MLLSTIDLSLAEPQC